MEIPSEAICPKAFLHDFKDAKERPDAFIEYCVKCGMKAVYHKDKSGRMDNRLYLRRHYRSFLQPHGQAGSHFRKCWGDRAYWHAIRSRRVKKKLDWDEAYDDAKKYLKDLQKEKTAL